MKKKIALHRDTLCELFKIDAKKVNKVKEDLPEDDIIIKLADTFRVLGDPTRTRILLALSQKELCVCELTFLLNISQSAISHQLRILRNMNLVKYRKDGRMVYYSLDDSHIKSLIEEGLNHMNE